MDDWTGHAWLEEHLNLLVMQTRRKNDASDAMEDLHEDGKSLLGPSLQPHLKTPW